MKKSSQLCFITLASFTLAFGFSPSRLRARSKCGRFSSAAKRRFWLVALNEADTLYDGTEVFEDEATNQALSSLLDELEDDVPLPPLLDWEETGPDKYERSFVAGDDDSSADVGWSTSSGTSAPEENTKDVDPQVEIRNKQLRIEQAQLMKSVASAIHRKDSFAVKKADDMIEELFRIYDKNRQRPEFYPPVRAYNLLIQALAQQRNKGRSAARVLEEMRDNKIRPDLVSYTGVVTAYANSDNGALQAERLLFYVLEREEFVNDGGGTWIALVDSVLNAWGQEGTQKAAERANSILQRMILLQEENVKPGLVSYATVMKAFSRCGAVDRVMSIIDDFLQGRAELEPDIHLFNVALGAWANSRNPSSGLEAMRLLKCMEKLHEEKGSDSKPNVASYNIVITAWSRSGRDDAPMQAERILHMMQQSENTKPDIVSFNAVLNAWSQTSSEKAAPRAQQILEFLIEHPKLEPNVVTFCTVMNTWARSENVNKVEKAKELLERLLTMYEDARPEKPTPIPFNTLINACGCPHPDATNEEKRASLQVAASTFGRLRSYRGVKPDTVTYSNMIKCIGKLLPMGSTRIKLAREIFDHCINDGLVGELVWEEMTYTVPFSALEPILPAGLLENLQVGEDIEQFRLPRRWRQNVPWSQDRIKREQRMEKEKKELGVKKKPRNLEGRLKLMGTTTYFHDEPSWGSVGEGL